jgi:hypothetical protein
MSNQLTLVHEGEFVICSEIVYTPAMASLTAVASMPINTMKATSVRLGNDIIPLPFLRSQERKAVSEKIRIDGPIAARIARELQLDRPVAASGAPGTAGKG